MLALDFALIEDINTAGLPLQIGKPTNLTKVGETVFFTTERIAFNDPQTLWKIDPTTHEAVLLKTFSPLGVNTAAEFTEFNGSLYFSANDGSTGFELWKSDGTAEGTVLVKDTAPGPLGGSVVGLTNANGILYFVASDRLAVPSVHLWKSDGTTAGTVQLANIGKSISTSPYIVGPNGAPAVSYSLTAAGDKVFFVANGAGGAELWRSDGTAAGTGIVADIVPGPAGSAPVELTAIGDWLYFSANDGVHGQELWRSDGTAAGTTMVLDLQQGAGSGFVRELIEVDGTLYFRGNDGVGGSELWKSDGTAVGTMLVKEFRSGSAGGAPGMFYNWAGTLYFSAATDEDEYSLWKSDGTAGGTTLVRAVSEGGPYLALPRDYDTGAPWAAVMDGELYFLGDLHRELWKTDGTAAGTTPVRRLTPNDNAIPWPPTAIETSMIEAGGRIYFIQPQYGSSSVVPARLMVSDGTASGTVQVSEAGSGTGNAFGAWIEETINGVSYFVAEDVDHGSELWRTDGTAAGTYMVRDVYPGVLGSSIYRLTVLDDVLYFSADDGISQGLWRSDGTEAGTWKLAATTTIPAWPTAANGLVFFQLYQYSTGLQLWSTDGTAAGTALVKTVSSVGGVHSTSPMVEFNDEVYFQTNDGLTGVELWKSGGTSAGTVLVKDVAPGAANSYSTPLTVAGGLLYFAVNSSGTLDRELWQTDGTSAGTSRVGGAIPLKIPGQYNGAIFQEANGILYFAGNGGDGAGVELWRTDGSVAGTFRLTDIAPGSESASFTHLANANGTLIFAATNVSGQRAVWRSDGSLPGTTLVTLIAAGSETVKSFVGFTQIGDDSWFTVGVAPSTLELWRTDGTTAGTVLVESFELESPGTPVASAPIAVGDRLVLPLTTGAHGRELWSAQFIETPPLAGDFNRDGVVDGADFLFWQRNFGAAANPYGAGADGDQSGRIGSGDLNVWKGNYGPAVPLVVAATAPAALVARDVHDASLPIAAPLAAITASVASPDEANSWSVVAQRPSPRAEQGRLTWFLDSLSSTAPAGRTAALHVAARESAVFPAGTRAALWISEAVQAWDLLARESLVAGASGPGGVSFSLRPEKSSPFDGEEIDWRLEQLFQTERLAGTESRDEL